MVKARRTSREDVEQYWMEEKKSKKARETLRWVSGRRITDIMARKHEGHSRKIHKKNLDI